MVHHNLLPRRLNNKKFLFTLSIKFVNDMKKILSNPITKEFYKIIYVMAKGKSHGPNGVIIEFYIFF